jgi:Flp pilus assembly protein TadD
MPRTNRFAQTLDRPSRVPVALSAGAALLVGVLVACGTKGERKPDDTVISSTDTAIVTQPETTQPPIAVASMQQGGEAVNVSFASAESLYQRRQYDEATTAFRGYTERRPDNPWGHYMLGLAAWKSGDLETARGALERSLELDGTNVKTLLNLGRVLLEQDRPNDALTRITAAEEIDPMSPEVHRMLGRVHSALGEPDSAIASYRTALSYDENDVWSMNNMALVLIQQERYEEALPPLARAVQLKAGSPVFQNNFGIALERTGHFTDATEAYRAALAADSTYRKASLSLSRVEGKVDTVEPVDVAMLAVAFQNDVRFWRETRLEPLATAGVKPER